MLPVMPMKSLYVPIEGHATIRLHERLITRGKREYAPTPGHLIYRFQRMDQGAGCIFVAVQDRLSCLSKPGEQSGVSLGL